MNYGFNIFRPLSIKYIQQGNMLPCWGNSILLEFIKIDGNLGIGFKIVKG
jgi:hypothetical protein